MRSRLVYALMAELVVALPALGLAQETAPQAAQGGDSVSARLGRLEDKVRDLQVMIGTLESLLRAKPGTVLPQEAPAVAQDSSLGPRIDALETQITALTSHIEQIGKQMSAFEAKLSAAPMPPPAPPTPSAEPPPERQGQALTPPPDSATAAAPPESGDDGDPSKQRWYGPKPGSDELAALLERQAASDPQNLTAALPGGDAQTLYQQGYGALLQKDYASAEIAFSQLVDAYPGDPLASNAQYWLGESYYVRGDYKNAADAFLKGYKIQVGRQSAGHANQARHVARGTRPKGCGLFDLRRAQDQISSRAGAYRRRGQGLAHEGRLLT